MVRPQLPRPNRRAAGRFVISTYDALVCHAINAEILRHRLPRRQQLRCLSSAVAMQASAKVGGFFMTLSAASSGRYAGCYAKPCPVGALPTSPRAELRTRSLPFVGLADREGAEPGRSRRPRCGGLGSRARNGRLHTPLHQAIPGPEKTPLSRVALDQPSVERVARKLRTLIEADERVHRPRPITLPKLPSTSHS